jgi:polysaccharide biosynthesis transport protein
MQTTTPSNQNEAALHAIDYWQVIKNRYGVIILTLLLVFMTAAVITYVMPKRYQSRATIEIKPPASLIDAFGNLSAQRTYGRVTQNFFNTEFEKIKSSNALKRVVDKLDLTARWGMDQQLVLATLDSIVDAQPRRGTDLVDIRVRHRSPEDARDVAAEVAKAYQEYRGESEAHSLQRGFAELKRQIRIQEDTVEQERKLLAQIVRARGIIYSGRDSMYRGMGSDDEMAARDAVTEYTKLEQEVAQLKSTINTLLRYDEEQLISFAAGLEMAEGGLRMLHPKYLEMKTAFEGLKNQGLGPQHPMMISKSREIEETRKHLEEGVVALRDTLTAKLQMAEARLDDSKKRMVVKKDDAVTESIARAEYDDARTRYEYQLDLLKQLQVKLSAEEINEKMLDDSIIVHDDPVTSQTPVSPNVPLNLILGAVVGLIFGVGIAFFLEYIDTSVKSLEDVERYLQVPVLAVIPRDVGLLHKQSGMSPDAEAYRILRTNIEFNRKNPEDNSITVVSGGAGEGKSTTLVNLAYVCAQGGYTTLMLDADLRRPRLHTFFDINNSVGLTNYLTTELMLEDVILQTPVDNLYFMPSGILPADAAGILNSRRMSELIQDVKQRFDLVLVDSPPILGVSDASVLASEVDLTMIVVQHRKLPRHMLLRVKAAVENVGGTVIGVVLNNVDVRSDSQYQYYTSYYTYYAPAESQIGPPVGSSSSSSRKGQPAEAKAAAAAPAGNDGDLY